MSNFQNAQSFFSMFSSIPTPELEHNLSLSNVNPRNVYRGLFASSSPALILILTLQIRTKRSEGLLRSRLCTSLTLSRAELSAAQPFLQRWSPNICQNDDMSSGEQRKIHAWCVRYLIAASPLAYSREAMNLLAKEVDPAKTKTVIEYSSGSTVISMSLVSRVYHGIDDVHAYLSNKTSEAKLRMMQFFGLKL